LGLTDQQLEAVHQVDEIRSHQTSQPNPGTGEFRSTWRERESQLKEIMGARIYADYRWQMNALAQKLTPHQDPGNPQRAAGLDAHR
jgi:hypothetical protein